MLVLVSDNSGTCIKCLILGIGRNWWVGDSCIFRTWPFLSAGQRAWLVLLNWRQFSWTHTYVQTLHFILIPLDFFLFVQGLSLCALQLFPVHPCLPSQHPFSSPGSFAQLQLLSSRMVSAVIWRPLLSSINDPSLPVTPSVTHTLTNWTSDCIFHTFWFSSLLLSCLHTTKALICEGSRAEKSYPGENLTSPIFQAQSAFSSQIWICGGRMDPPFAAAGSSSKPGHVLNAGGVALRERSILSSVSPLWFLVFLKKATLLERDNLLEVFLYWVE